MTILDNNYIVYDIEVLPNLFSFAFEKPDQTSEYYEISPRRNDIHKIMDVLRACKVNKTFMVGYNNTKYDYPVLHYLIHTLYGNSYTGAKTITKQCYIRSKAILNSRKQFEFTIWDNQCYAPQVDLMAMHDLNAINKLTSLKKLQFNMRMTKMKELELDFDKPVDSKKQCLEIEAYNRYDVRATHNFLIKSKTAVAFRHSMSDPVGTPHGKYYYNSTDQSVGEKYFIGKLEEALGKDKLYYYDHNGKRHKHQTPRKEFKIADIIFDYIDMGRPVYKEILERVKQYNVWVVDGKFQWHEDYNYPLQRAKAEQWEKNLKKNRPNMERADYTAERKEMLAFKHYWSDKNIEFEADGVEFTLGKGGIHASVNNRVIESNSKFVIIDLDVTSFYPSVGIENKLYPEHLGNLFCEVYASLKRDRLRYDKKKHPVENYILKIALNGAYGKTNSAYSVLYDPMYTMATTINGQLLLIKLWEMVSRIQGSELLQANTDGITIRLLREDVKKLSRICKKWQKLTGLHLEHAVYSKMWIRDNNNYIAQKTDGSIKTIGAYNYDRLFYETGHDGDKVAWEKKHSMQVVKKAAIANLVHGIEVEEFITGHDDIYDFFSVTTVPRSSKLHIGDGKQANPDRRGDDDPPQILIGHNEQIQRASRYIVSKSGGFLTKEMEPTATKPYPRLISIDAGKRVTVYNDIDDDHISNYDIDYSYYIREANKLVEVFK